MNHLLHYLKSVFLILVSFINAEWMTSIQDSINDVETIKSYVRDGFKENAALAGELVRMFKTDVSLIVGAGELIPGLKPILESISKGFTPLEGATPEEALIQENAWNNTVLQGFVHFLTQCPDQWKSLIYHGLVRNLVVIRVKNDLASNRVIDMVVSIIYNHQTKPTEV